MTNDIKLTDNERAVLNTFGITHANADAIKDDPVSVITDIAELSETLGKKRASLRGVIGSLIKKGLLETIEGGERGELPCQIVTSEGVDAVLADARRAGMQALVTQAIVGNAMIAEGNNDQQAHIEAAHAGDTTWALHVGGAKSLCAGLRSLAFAWKGTRAEFIALAEAHGVNTHTAKTQFQKGYRAPVN